MSNKRPRLPAAAPTGRRVLIGVLVGVLLAATAVIVIRRVRDDDTTNTSTAAPTPPSTSLGPPELEGTYDVTLLVSAAEYGATWPANAPRLAPGQTVLQRWTVDCLGATCAVDVSRAHVAEDPDGAVVTATGGGTYDASATVPARADAPDQPTGCGAVNAIDRLQLTLTAANDRLTGSYVVHHPTVHVEGPVGDQIGSCDSFNVQLTLTGRRT